MKAGFLGFCLVPVLVFSACQADKGTAVSQAPLETPTSQPGKLIRCRVVHFPPQYYLDAAGQWTGLDVELMRAVVVQAGYEPHFVDLPWSRALDELRQGRLQLMANLTITQERDTFVRWIGPQRQPKLVLVVRQEHSELPIDTVADLVMASRRMALPYGIQSGVFYSTELNALIEDSSYSDVFETVPAATTNFQKLVAGRILGLFEDYDSSRYLLSVNPGYSSLVLHAFTASESVVYFGASRAGLSDEQFQALQSAYVALEFDGSLEAIRQRTWID